MGSSTLAACLVGILLSATSTTSTPVQSPAFVQTPAPWTIQEQTHVYLIVAAVSINGIESILQELIVKLNETSSLTEVRDKTQEMLNAFREDPIHVIGSTAQMLLPQVDKLWQLVTSSMASTQEFLAVEAISSDVELRQLLHDFRLELGLLEPTLNLLSVILNLQQDA